MGQRFGAYLGLAYPVIGFVGGVADLHFLAAVLVLESAAKQEYLAYIAEDFVDIGKYSSLELGPIPMNLKIKR